MKTYHLFNISFALLLLVGCSSYDILRPEDIATEQDNDIAVVTTDGLRILFLRDQYTIFEPPDSTFIRGKGTILIKNDRIVSLRFTGAIAREQVKHVEVISNTTPGAFFMWLVVIPAAALAVLLVMWFASGASW